MAGARSCAALFISAPGSNHGKTTVTAALAHFHRRQGRKVRAFKTGPDFLDPMVLERASGNPVYQLDLWMGGENHCRELLYEAAGEADLVLVEGAMGLFDGSPSSADLAQKLGMPILAVIDASGVAQTLGAVAYGLVNLRSGLRLAGVLANSIASARHAEMIEQGMPEGIRYFGGLPRDAQFTLPGRHLGLVQADEINDLDSRLAAAAASLAATGLCELPEKAQFASPAVESSPRLLSGVRIGVARDAAFSFIYPANLDLLRAMGAELVFFSPLRDPTLPDVDSLYLPGGYPELHLQPLQENASMKIGLEKHFRQAKPIYAECGGMLYLLESLTDRTGKRGEMVGLLSGHAILQSRLRGLGYQSAPMPAGVLRAHTFHYSVVDAPHEPIARGECLHNTSEGEAVYQRDRLIASYLHCYFPSNPVAAAQLFSP